MKKRTTNRSVLPALPTLPAHDPHIPRLWWPAHHDHRRPLEAGGVEGPQCAASTGHQVFPWRCEVRGGGVVHGVQNRRWKKHSPSNHEEDRSRNRTVHPALDPVLFFRGFKTICRHPALKMIVTGKSLKISTTLTCTILGKPALH